MKRGAYLENTARGGICDPVAIADGLKTGRLAGYAADIGGQPFPAGVPVHIAGASLSAQARYAAGTREVLECWFDGAPVRDDYLIVDRGKLTRLGKLSAVGWPVDRIGSLTPHHAPTAAARSVPRNQRWAGWLSSRRCQIIESETRGEAKGNGRIARGQMATRSGDTPRTTASELEPISKNISECSGTFAMTRRTKPRSASASSMKLVSSPPDVLLTWGSAAKDSSTAQVPLQWGCLIEARHTHRSQTDTFELITALDQRT